VLFNRPSQTLDFDSQLLKRDRDAATLDSIAQEFGPSELPLSKAGAPFVSPPPRFSIVPQPIEPLQWLDLARFLSPNLVDYFTKTLPPAPPLPATPGKIPSADNPYAPGAAFEAATFLLPEARIGGAAVGAVEKRAAEAALQAARAAADSPALTRAAEQLVTGPYGTLSGSLPPGFQAHHLNQGAVFNKFIPRAKGLSLAVEGNALTGQGTQHFTLHQSLEQFWDQFRRGGNRYPSTPTNAEFGEAARQSAIAAGFSPAQASDLAAKAVAERATYGLSETAAVPRIPGRINQKR